MIRDTQFVMYVDMLEAKHGLEEEEIVTPYIMDLMLCHYNVNNMYIFSVTR